MSLAQRSPNWAGAGESSSDEEDSGGRVGTGGAMQGTRPPARGHASLSHHTPRPSKRSPQDCVAGLQFGAGLEYSDSDVYGGANSSLSETLSQNRIPPVGSTAKRSLEERVRDYTRDTRHDHPAGSSSRYYAAPLKYEQLYYTVCF